MRNQALEDYLKVIFEIQEECDKVSTSALAKRLNIAAASATQMLKKLADINLVTYEKYQGVRLTPAGRRIALEVLRHHRLVELFLAEALGVPWDKVHDEAERWEHVISEEIGDRIDALLGHPTRDPHGSPIPDRQGRMIESSTLTLAGLQANQQATIVEVRDHDPELLRYLGKMNLYPETILQVISVAPFDGPLNILVNGSEITIGRKVANQIYVNPAAVSREKAAGAKRQSRGIPQRRESRDEP